MSHRAFALKQHRSLEVPKLLRQLATCACDKNDGTSGIVLFLRFHRIEQRHCSASIEIMAVSDEQTRVLRWFTAPTLKVALGIAGLARCGINKMVQAVSADPTTEFVAFFRSFFDDADKNVLKQA